MINVISWPERGPLARFDSQLTTPRMPPLAVMSRNMPPMMSVNTMIYMCSSSYNEPETFFHFIEIYAKIVFFCRMPERNLKNFFMFFCP